jgi:hypothetical protein
MSSSSPLGLVSPDPNVPWDPEKGEKANSDLFAGPDAVDGSFNRIRFHGHNGETLKGHWKDRPTSFMGFSIANFPNMFMIGGPAGPFASKSLSLAQTPFGGTRKLSSHVLVFLLFCYRSSSSNRTSAEFITETIKKAEESQVIVEAEPEAEEKWVQHCDEMAADSLFKTDKSWIFGHNIPGKKVAVMFHFGGLKKYSEKVRDSIDNGFRGFKFTPWKGVI